MRYATATNTGKNCYGNLLDSCQHSRLKAALTGPLAYAPQARRPLLPAHPPVVASDATKAYLWVACMSVASLLSVVVSGTINA
jgi:hypothetical protein